MPRILMRGGVVGAYKRRSKIINIKNSTFA